MKKHISCLTVMALLTVLSSLCNGDSQDQSSTNPQKYQSNNQVNMNLLPVDAPDIRALGDNVPSPPGTYTVVGEGSATGIDDGNGTELSPADLASKIQADPDYTPGEPVQVDACYFGSGDAAQALANILNAPVSAPEGEGYVGEAASSVDYTTFYPNINDDVGLKSPIE